MKDFARDLKDIGKTLYYYGIRAKVLPSEVAQPFVIASGPRTGSTHLQRLLNSHPHAVCMHELFKPTPGPPVFFRNYIGHRRRLLNVREQSYEKFLNEVLLTPQAPWVKAIGFKAIFIQPQKTEWEHAWQALSTIENLRVIWLSRNPIQTAISYLTALKSGAWVGKPTTGSIHIDIEHFMRFINRQHSLEESAREILSGRQGLDISYEQLVENTDTERARLCEFLNIENTTLDSGIRKQNQKDLREFVENYDEVKEALVGTRWETDFQVASAAK